MSDVQASMPEELDDLRWKIADDIQKVREIEDEVNRAHYERKAPTNILQIDGILNDIQQNLEMLLRIDIYAL